MSQITQLYFLLNGYKIRILILIAVFAISSFFDLVCIKLVNLIASKISNPLLKFPGEEFIQANTDVSPFLILMYLSIFLFTFKFILAILVSYFSCNLSESLLKNLRIRLYSKLLESNYLIFLKRDRSEYINSLFTITSSFCNGLFLSTLKMVSEIMISFTIIIYLLFNNTLSITILSSLFIAFVLLYDLLLRKKMNFYGEIINFSNDQIISTINETVDGFKEIRIFDASNQYKKKLIDISTKLSKINTKCQILTLLPRYMLEFILILSFFFYSIIYFSMGATSDILPGLSVLGYAAMRLLPGFSAISNGLAQYRSGKHNVSTLYGELISDDHLELIPDSPSGNIILKNLALKDVSFSFNDNKVLEKVSLSIKNGEFIGIVGKSGAGKSTLINIILGLIKPTSGQIFLNGIPSELSSRNYHNIVATVAQKNFIPQGSVTNAITFGLNLNQEKLNASILRSSLNEFIHSIDRNFDYLLKENASNTSGGQAQRIAIARALYFERQLLVLDEPTSSLDADTEDVVLESLKKLKGSITLILVTHKKNCLDICDSVYELSNNTLYRLQ